MFYSFGIDMFNTQLKEFMKSFQNHQISIFSEKQAK